MSHHSHGGGGGHSHGGVPCTGDHSADSGTGSSSGSGHHHQPAARSAGAGGATASAALNANPIIHAIKQVSRSTTSTATGTSNGSALATAGGGGGGGGSARAAAKGAAGGRRRNPLAPASGDDSMDSFDAILAAAVLSSNPVSASAPAATAPAAAALATAKSNAAAAMSDGAADANDGDDQSGSATARDEIDALEVFDHIRHINDPEHPLTLEQLNVTQLELVNVDARSRSVDVRFTPTIPHCSMATLIGLCLRVKLLRSLPPNWKITVRITPGTHASEHAVNKQLHDKERVAAALENNHLLEVVTKCIAHTDVPPANANAHASGGAVPATGGAAGAGAGAATSKAL